jgi:cyclic pyranopterin phosphate synthase
MPAKGLAQDAGCDPLPFEQLTENIGWLMEYVPIERVKLTGGEPLLRSGVEALISSLVRIAGVREISMTTNGSLLPRRAEALRAAGLARVNISLDSLDPQRFAELSRGARLERTLAGIDAATAAGLGPIKLNAVLHRTTWKLDIPALLDFAAGHGFEIRFIELMRMGTERAWCDSEYVSVEEVQEWLAAQTTAVSMATPAALPARYTAINWRGVCLKVGWIAPRSHPFCASCERLRMDSRGRIRRCLMDSEILDLATLRRIRGHAAAEAFRAYIGGKHIPLEMGSESAMSQIGG